MKYTLLLVFLLEVLLAGTIAFGQGVGFQLKGPVTFGGFTAGEPVWVIGNGIKFVVPSPVVQKHLRDLEGQQVRITVERASK